MCHQESTVSLPGHFKANGYESLSVGKVFGKGCMRGSAFTEEEHVKHYTSEKDSADPYFTKAVMARALTKEEEEANPCIDTKIANK